ncbi:PH domain-containing protein [uncultured Alteromonas sp.]|jgi:putative membrane protein|uniref:PH domain-containing protein n=1 Tax=uncultured Alteromonas sp. TaxID=179113 RepID=UPI0025EC953F|nr:PH domain-containing protein [uncultured Alteromonas sp.]
MAEQVLRSASFDPKVKTYWLFNLLIVSGLTIIGIPLLIISVPLILFISERMLRAMSATLTERKLVVKRGVLFKVEKSIPLEKITDVAMSQGPLMRAMGLYRLSFETAGQSGPGALVSLIGIENAEAFREAILTQKDNNSATPRSKPEPSTGQASQLAELTESVKRIEQMLATLINNKS